MRWKISTLLMPPYLGYSSGLIDLFFLIRWRTPDKWLWIHVSWSANQSALLSVTRWTYLCRCLALLERANWRLLLWAPTRKVFPLVWQRMTMDIIISGLYLVKLENTEWWSCMVARKCQVALMSSVYETPPVWRSRSPRWSRWELVTQRKKRSML